MDYGDGQLQLGNYLDALQRFKGMTWPSCTYVLGLIGIVQRLHFDPYCLTLESLDTILKKKLSSFVYMA